MSRTDPAAAYEDLCEQLFRDWLTGQVGRQGLPDLFSVDHCPQPYLDFAPGDDPLIYVTLNPGRGEPFQLRSAVDTPSSPIKSRESYRENARILASWYRVAGVSKISAAARTRIEAMGSLARRLGATGVRQVEIFPLHSEHGDARRLPSRDMQLPGPLGECRARFKSYIASASIVIAISGGAVDRSATAAGRWADAIGLRLARASLLELKSSVSGRTVGVFAEPTEAGLRVLFCCRGANPLPAREGMPEVVRFLSGLMQERRPPPSALVKRLSG